MSEPKQETGLLPSDWFRKIVTRDFRLQIIICMIFFVAWVVDFSSAENLPIYGCGGLPLDAPASQGPDYALRPAGMRQVQFNDSFFDKRIQTNRTVSLWHDLEQLRMQGGLSGMEYYAGQTNACRGSWVHDMDLFRLMEGMGYADAVQSDAKMQKTLDGLTALVAAAQRPNGYLYTWMQFKEPESKWYDDKSCWSSQLARLVEAAVARYSATGKKDLLAVAIKSADLMISVQQTGKAMQASNHPELEMALVKLFRVTGAEVYLNAAETLVTNMYTCVTAHARGTPFLAREEATGHSVAAIYGYCGAADIAQLKSHPEIRRTLEKKWENMIGRKIYIHGGVGVGRCVESFSGDYDLPNDDSYSESCAAMANVLWQHRMFLASGEAKYMDVLERVLYNNYLAGMSLSGDRYFYVNPMQADGIKNCSRGRKERHAWDGCPCCIVNYSRFMSLLPQLAYAAGKDEIYVNLFAAGTASLPMGNGVVELKQETRYPWDGAVRLTVSVSGKTEFALKVRIPGWMEGRPLPTDLYRYLNPEPEKAEFKVNGRKVDVAEDKGFAVIRRKWKKNDVVSWSFPMPVRQVLANDKVASCTGRVAVERGPLVYCAEGVDNGGNVFNYILQARPIGFSCEWKPDLLGGIAVITADAQMAKQLKDKTIAVESGRLVLVPYYAWNHRGADTMTIWFPADKTFADK